MSVRAVLLLLAAIALLTGGCTDAAGTRGKSVSEKVELIKDIAHAGEPDAGKRIAAFLDDPEPQVIAIACISLGQVKSRENIPSLVALLKHPDDQVANLAGAGLSEMIDERDRALLPELHSQLAHRFLLARISAIEALGKLKSPTSTSALLKRLEVEEPAARLYIVIALGDIRDQAALPALEGYLEKVKKMDHSSPNRGRNRGGPPHPDILQAVLERALASIRSAT